MMEGINSFNGTLLTEFGRLTNLQYLNVAVNGITGTIPTEIGKLTKLKVINLCKYMVQAYANTKLSVYA